MTNIIHIIPSEQMPAFQNVPTSGLASGVTLPVIVHEMVEITGTPATLQAN